MSDEYMLRNENRFRDDTSWKEVLSPKSVVCRYYRLPGGCVRGEKCFYAHGQEEVQILKRTRESSPGLVPSTASSRLQVGKINHSQEDLARKVFVGGLSSTVEADDLRDFFEEKFGPVMDAVVIESHLGDQVHSRGFGFVTFENENSVLSAVQAHFVNIFGKKVEIKGAVPRSGSSQLVIAKGSSGIPIQFHDMSRESSKSDVIRQRLLDINLSSAINGIEAQGDTQGFEVDNDLHSNKDLACANKPPPAALNYSPSSVTECHSWVPIFEQWLPKFLLEACNRLKEGEWYPLSSLKGDFRATCGLELEHENIGYHKLNDFIRSLPHLCRIKIVPVGIGPATHMVLLPAGSRMATTTSHQTQQLHQSGYRAGASLVETGRTYAAAICHETTSSGNGSVSSGSITTAENEVNNLLREHAVQASVTSGQISAACNACDSLDLDFLRQSSRLVENGSGKENWDPGRGFCPDGQTANFIHQNRLHCLNSPISYSRNSEFQLPSAVYDPSNSYIHQVAACSSKFKDADIAASPKEEPKIAFVNEQLTLNPFSNLKTEHSAPPTYSNIWAQTIPSNQETSVQQITSGSSLREVWMQNLRSEIYNGHERPTIPIDQLTLAHFSAFKHEHNALPTYRSTWEENLPSILETRVQQSPSSNPCEELSHISIRPSAVGKARGSLQKQFLHPLDKDGEKVFAACSHCKRKAIWVAFPCKHYALCSACRDSMYRHWGTADDSSCPVCSSAVDKWMKLEAVEYLEA